MVLLVALELNHGDGNVEQAARALGRERAAIDLEAHLLGAEVFPERLFVGLAGKVGDVAHKRDIVVVFAAGRFAFGYIADKALYLIDGLVITLAVFLAVERVD